VLDTNVLLHDPQSIFKFEDNNLAIPVEVLEELDAIKSEQSTERGRNARRVHRLLGKRVFLHRFDTADVWIRDYGPLFVKTGKGLRILDFRFNAWGNKYATLLRDDRMPEFAAAHLGIPLEKVDLVLEGGSVDFDGRGTVLTTEQCLLNPNRNPTLTRADIEELLRDCFGVREILWLGDGIEGDDTDGHIDDLTRFVGSTKVVTVVESNRADPNHAPLAANRRLLDTLSVGGRPLAVTELPMPEPQYLGEQRLPASYANFYIANGAVLVPTFACPADDEACGILGECLPDRRVVPVDCRVLIAGLGALHCLTQQVPAVPARTS